jgi:hypothetical protein
MNRVHQISCFSSYVILVIFTLSFWHAVLFSHNTIHTSLHSSCGRNICLLQNTCLSYCRFIQFRRCKNGYRVHVAVPGNYMMFNSRTKCSVCVNRLAALVIFLHGILNEYADIFVLLYTSAMQRFRYVNYSK